MKRLLPILLLVFSVGVGAAEKYCYDVERSNALVTFGSCRATEEVISKEEYEKLKACKFAVKCAPARLVVGKPKQGQEQSDTSSKTVVKEEPSKPATASPKHDAISEVPKEEVKLAPSKVVGTGQSPLDAILKSLSSDVVPVLAGASLLERECYQTFHSSHLWNGGDPRDDHWDIRCWDFVSQDEKNWIGSAETKRLQREAIEKNKQRQEAEKERKRKEKERLAEKKKREAEVAARRAREEREQRQLILANYKTMPLEEIENFLKGRFSLGELVPVVDGYFERVFALYFDDAENAFSAIRKALQRANSAGVDLSALSKIPVQMIVLMSPKSREGSAHEYDAVFSAETIPHLFLHKQTVLSDVVDDTVQGVKPYVILNVAGTTLERDVTEHETVESEYQVGVKDVLNPVYENRRRELEDAKAVLDEVLQRNPNNTRYPALAALGKAIALRKPRAAYEVARERFRGTPRLLKKPIFQSYSFRKATVRIKKNTLIEVFTTDVNRKALAHSELSISEGKEFIIAHGLKQKDRHLYRNKSGTSTNEDALSYEKKGIRLSLGPLFEKSRNFKSSSTYFSSLGEIKKAILEKRISTKTNIAIAAANDDVSKSTDERFKSIVIILHPDGGLGTGFYVNEDTVLTNYHVISGSPYVEVVLVDGSETFGKVVAKDIRLDLAILKVQKRGIPVKFYNGNRLAVGATVDAIGHPKGLEFSLTRGTVSGIRRLPSYYDPGGKAVRFIQSDVAFNPGNSGGPLFLDNYVVGVNDWKLAATELEGLSFSIHYFEVIKFLKNQGL